MIATLVAWVRRLFGRRPVQMQVPGEVFPKHAKPRLSARMTRQMQVHTRSKTERDIRRRVRKNRVLNSSQRKAG